MTLSAVIVELLLTEALTVLLITLTIAPTPTPTPVAAVENPKAPAIFPFETLLFARTFTSPAEETVELLISAVIVLLITSVAMAPEKV